MPIRADRETADGRSNGRAISPLPTIPCKATQPEYEDVDGSFACFLLSQSGHQGGNARRRPALDDQIARWLDIDAVTGAEHDAAAAGGPRHADAAVDDEDRCLGTFGVHRPFGAAHRRNRLRRHHVEPGAARLLRHFEQQGLVAEFDGIDMAVAVAIPELELRTAFGHDCDRRRAMERLCSLDCLLCIATEFRLLGYRITGE